MEADALRGPPACGGSAHDTRTHGPVRHARFGRKGGPAKVGVGSGKGERVAKEGLRVAHYRNVQGEDVPTARPRNALHRYTSCPPWVSETRP